MLKFRRPQMEDMLLYFKWANDPLTRANSFTQMQISLGDHEKWYSSKLESETCLMYLFENENQLPVGQVRIDISVESKTAVIGISVDVESRGKGYAVEMLQISVAHFFLSYPDHTVFAHIFESNTASYKSFLKAGYKFFQAELKNGIPSLILYLSNFNHVEEH